MRPNSAMQAANASATDAVLVVDRVRNPTSGEIRVLLLQSFMPAQDMHVLKQPDPTTVSHPIPGNDDAIRSVGLLTRVIADAVAEGLIQRHQKPAEGESAEPLAEWERELLEAGAPAAEVAVEAAVVEAVAEAVAEEVVAEAAAAAAEKKPAAKKAAAPKADAAEKKPAAKKPAAKKPAAE